MLSSFDRLPPEMQDSIFKWLPVADLAAFSATSKLLNHNLMPYLFRHIEMTWAHRDKHPECDRISPLLRSVLNRPHLAMLVNQFTLRFVCEGTEICYRRNDPVDISWVKKRRFTAFERAAVESAVDDADVKSPEMWKVKILKNRELSAVIAILISRLTNLKDLSIPEPFLRHVGGEDGWFPALFRSTLLSQQRPDNSGSKLAKLSSLTLGESDCYRILNQQASPLAFMLASRLPNLQQLECWGGCFDDGFEYDEDYSSVCTPPGNLRSLRFHQSSVEDKVLFYMLRSQPNLSNLVYDGFWGGSRTPLDLEEVSDTLQHVAETLTTLKLRFDVYRESGYLGTPTPFTDPVENELGSLQNFARLEALDISLFMLFGCASPAEAPLLAEYLPPGLKRLTINNDLWKYSSWHTWKFADLLSVMTTFLGSGDDPDTAPWRLSTPKLEEIAFDGSEHGFSRPSESDLWVDQDEENEGNEEDDEDEDEKDDGEDQPVDANESDDAQKLQQLIKMCKRQGLRCTVLL